MFQLFRVYYSVTVTKNFDDSTNLGVILIPSVKFSNSRRSINSAELGDVKLLKDLPNRVPLATEGLNHIVSVNEASK